MISTSARPRVRKSDPESRERLTTAQYDVARERGTGRSGVNRTALACAPRSDAVAD
jgi:hypothetical protein